MLDFQPIDLRNASETEYQCLSEFKNQIKIEYLPDDPPSPLEEYVQEWKTLPEFMEYDAHVAWNSSHTKIVAFCRATIFNTGDNEHLVRFGIEVLPEHRRQGLGRQALNLLLPFAKKHKRTLWMVFTFDNIPATAHFLERLGAHKGSEMKMNQLKLVELDRGLIERWLEKSAGLKKDFDLGLWDGEYPEANIEDIAALFQEVANDEPRDNLEMGDMKFTPEILRGWEKNMFATGNQRWAMYLRSQTTGKLAGMTEVIWNPNRASILNQGGTGVYPQYRNKGLGRWLKAEMMQKILQERPEVEFVRTGNANSNAPMLKINIEMGFKPYVSNTIWQVETDKIEAYLSEGHV